MKRKLMGIFIAAVMIMTACASGVMPAYAEDGWTEEGWYDDGSGWYDDGSQYTEDWGPAPDAGAVWGDDGNIQSSDSPFIIPDGQLPDAVQIIDRGGTRYLDFTKAVAGSSSGDVLKLTEDAVLANPITISWSWEGTLTLDLNGHEIRMHDYSENITNDHSGAYSTTTDGGLFILDGGIFRVIDSAASDPYAEEYGSIYSTNSSQPIFKLTSTQGVATTLEIEGGSFLQGYDIQEPVVGLEDAYGNTLTPQEAEQYGYDFSVNVSGGAFSKQIPAEFVASGYSLEQSGDIWKVTESQGETYYTVSFNSMAEGVYGPDSQTIQEGYTANDPGALYRDGYTFDGWYDLDTNAWYDFSAPVYRDLNLGAWWTEAAPVTYTVSFSSQAEGVAAPADQTVQEGYTVTDPGAIERDGYTFEGWYNLETGSWYDFSAPVYGNLSLGAWWSEAAPVTYTVTFSSQAEGVAAPADQTVQEGYTVTDPGAIERSGYKFEGWYNLETGAWYDFSAPVYGNLNLGAWWSEVVPETYTVTFSSQAEGVIAPPAQNVQEGSTVTDPGALTRSGYKFEGWYNLETGAWYDFSAPVHGNLSLGAWWVEVEPANYTVTFKTQAEDVIAPAPQTVKEGTTATDPGPLSRKGYEFAGWFQDSEGYAKYDFNIPVTQDLTIYAVWTQEPTQPETFTVTFYSEYGTVPSGQLVESGKQALRPEDPAAAGYVFEGWYSDSEYYYPYDFNAPVSSNLTLYAKWSQQPTTIQYYTVSFYTDRGVSPAAQSVAEGSLAARPADPTSDGYVFGGWFTDNGFQYPYDFNAPVTGNLNLYAKWGELPSQNCIVSFVSNGYGDAPNPQTVRRGDLAARPADPAAAGYTFSGWFTDAACTTAFDFRSPVNSDITLYAKWVANGYTVMFDSNGGTGTMASQLYTYGTSAYLPGSTFSRTGYYFAGWNTAADGSGYGFADRGEVLNLTTEPGATVTLYAQWKNKYNVIEGIDAKIQRGTQNGLTFRVDGEYSNFTGIRIDDNNVASNAYTSWSGSTYVQLKPEYINQLTAERHTIRFMFTDGSCQTGFEVLSGTPTTGDTNNAILWIIVGIAALIVIAVTMMILIIRRRRQRTAGYYDDFDDYDERF